VVLKEIWHPGDGFAGLGRSIGEHIPPGEEKDFWRDQVEATIAYWTGPGKDAPAPDPIERAPRSARHSEQRGRRDQASAQYGLRQQAGSLF
jgi:hypothetical protein